MSPKAADVRPPARPKPGIVEVAASAASKNEVAAVTGPSAPPMAPTPQVSPAPPPPTVFKAIGYVEKAGGQLEAIILQEDQIQVVHLGDEIAGRYRVTRITPDLVDAIDETVAQIPVAKPGSATPELVAAIGAGKTLTPPLATAPGQPEVSEGVAEGTHPSTVQAAEPIANSLGYVQQADGKIEAVVADGESVRLVPETPAVAMAQATPPGDIQKPSPLSQGSPKPVIGVSSTVGAMADHLVPSGGIPDVPVIRQASYQVPIPATEEPAPSQVSTLSSEGAAEVVNTSSEPTVAISAAMPDGSSDRLTKLPVEMKPLGFVVKADGEFAAILSEDDEVYIVREGDRFAGHYRAVSVSADVVEAVEEPPRIAQPPPFAAPLAFPDWLSASAAQGPSLFANENCSGCKSSGLGEVSAVLPKDLPAAVESPAPKLRVSEQLAATSAKGPQQKSAHSVKQPEASPDSATFIFQTLGYVETEGGEMQAIVADGSQVYLVKQGETFADRYRATSVDPILVLAVRVSPEQKVTDFLSAQTESGGKPASKEMSGYSHLPVTGMANAQTFHQVDASGSPVLTDVGANLFSSMSIGFDLQSYFFMADNPKFGF